MTLHEDMTRLRQVCDQFINAITQPGKEHPMKKPCVRCHHSGNLHIEGECVMCSLLAYTDITRPSCLNYQPPAPWWMKLLTRTPKTSTR